MTALCVKCGRVHGSESPSCKDYQLADLRAQLSKAQEDMKALAKQRDAAIERHRTDAGAAWRWFHIAKMVARDQRLRAEAAKRDALAKGALAEEAIKLLHQYDRHVISFSICDQSPCRQMKLRLTPEALRAPIGRGSPQSGQERKEGGTNPTNPTNPPNPTNPTNPNP